MKRREFIALLGSAARLGRSWRVPRRRRRQIIGLLGTG